VSIGAKYYRYHDARASTGSEEFGFSSRVDLFVSEYYVIKETPKGVWIESYGTKRFVLHDSRKKFAHPTIESARESFIYRKKRQIKILSAQLKNAQQALECAMEQAA